MLEGAGRDDGGTLGDHRARLSRNGQAGSQYGVAMPDAELLACLLRVNAARAAGHAATADEAALAQRWRCHERLAVYGTLAPGRENHDQLAACPGPWHEALVRGRLGRRAFPVFTFDPLAAAVTMLVLHSPALPAAWAGLDRFEGADYRRILVPFECGDGNVGVANLYAAVEPVAP